MIRAAAKKSFRDMKGIPLTKSLGLAVCLPLLVVSLLVSVVFGCSLCFVLAEVVGKAMMDGFIGVELLSDLRVSFIAFMIVSLMTWASLNIVRSIRGGTLGSVRDDLSRHINCTLRITQANRVSSFSPVHWGRPFAVWFLPWERGIEWIHRFSLPPEVRRISKR